MSSAEFMPGGSLLRHALSDSATPQHLRVGDLAITLVDRGVLLVEPFSSNGMTSIVISAGIHGNETAPMELVDELVADVLSGQLLVACRMLVVLGNPPAALVQKRFIDQNLNRLFCGAHHGLGHPEAVRAAALERHVGQFFDQASGDRLHFDLHTSIRQSLHERFAIVPHDSPSISSGLLEVEHQAFMSRAGIEAILFASSSADTFSYFTSHHCGACAFTLELGSVQPFGQNDLTRLVPLRRGLIDLISGQSQGHEHDGIPATYDVLADVTRHIGEGFALHLDDDAPNFTRLQAGYILTSGGVGGFVVPEDSAVVFPNPLVPVGQRVALVVRRRPRELSTRRVTIPSRKLG